MTTLTPPPPYRPTGGCEAAQHHDGPMCGATPVRPFCCGKRCKKHEPQPRGGDR